MKGTIKMDEKLFDEKVFWYVEQWKDEYAKCAYYNRYKTLTFEEKLHDLEILIRDYYIKVR